MNLSQESQLGRNISRYGLDSRIGKAALSVKGTGSRMGERISVKPGYSAAIMDYRCYQKGDSVKDIDWKLSARTERLFVKIREGYRQTDFVIAVDGSESMRTSYDGGTSKFITGLTIAYIAGMVALKSRDRVYISYAGEKLRAHSGASLIDLLTGIELKKAPGAFWDSRIESSANIFLLSDFFIEASILSGYLKNLRHSTKNLYMITIHDPFEQKFDFSGRCEFLDPESDGSLLAETRSIEEKYRHLYNEHYRAVTGIGKSFGARLGKATTTEDPYHAFVKAVE